MDNAKTKEYFFDGASYQPTIIGEVDELIEKIELLKTKFPYVAKFFLIILEKNLSKNFSLEDWLIVTPYMLVWQENNEKLSWFERLFTEFADIYEEEWDKWVHEIVQKDSTTHAIYDRIYSYLLHLYAAIYLVRQGFTNIQFPPHSQEKGVDIVAFFNEQTFAIECKFVKTSKKFDSFFWRANRAFRDCTLGNDFYEFTKHLLISKNFIFPPGEEIRSLSPLHCTAIKFLIKEVYKDPFAQHNMSFKDEDEQILTYKYSPSLPVASLDFEQEYADKKALYLFDIILSATLDKAVKQLNDLKYSNHRKIIFLGIQLDELFLIDWTYPSIEERKLLAKLKMHYKHNIKIIFSEDVGFSMARYL